MSRGRSVRRRSAIALAIVNLLLVTASAPVSAQPAPQPSEAPSAPAALAAGDVNLRLVTSGLSSPTVVTHAGDGSGRLFIAERDGRIRVVKNGTLQPGVFLDMNDEVLSGGERGLLGLAFHLDFEVNRKLYVYYTNNGGDIVIREYLATPGLGAVDESTKTDMLVIEHSTYSNHNGGMLAFGPDRYLYIGTGDGGLGGDPFEAGQSINTLLGKVLRINIDTAAGGAQYSSPPDNPFVGRSGADQIWDFGLRNPWRFSFDRATGNLWIADVGQNAWEEINREPAGTGARNYGWDCREGKHWYETAGCDTVPPNGYTDPIAEYSHNLGCSVTGGYVYRGTQEPDLPGHYVLADYCSGRLWTISAAGSSLVAHRQVAANISSFGESESGEVFAVDLSGGRLYKVVVPPFTDIIASNFYYDIIWLADSGITSGCGGGKFCPNTAITREQMAAFLVRAFELPTTSNDYFTDDEASWAEGDINRVAAAGITAGCTATTYCPGAVVTRAQMAAFLARALDLPATGNDYFTDDEGHFAEADINRVRAAGITTGCTATKYCPSSLVTRGQMAAFLHRSLD